MGEVRCYDRRRAGGAQRCFAHTSACTHVEHPGARQRDRRAGDEQSRNRRVREGRALRPAHGGTSVVVLVHLRIRGYASAT